MPAGVEVAVMTDVEKIGEVEEVAVIKMEIPNFEIDEATSLQQEVDLDHIRGGKEARDRAGRASLPMLSDVVMEKGKERKQLNFLDSVKIAKRNIDQKKAILERMKQVEKVKRANLRDLKAEDVEETSRSFELAKTGAELQRRKEELEMMFKAFLKEKSDIVKRQQERDAKVADMEAEIEADEKIRRDKEEELERDHAEVQAALLLLQAAAPVE